MEKLVSVIIACHNGAPYIDTCIESLINQTYKNIEIIICDDFSNDDSYEKIISWCKRDNRIRALRNSHNRYAGATRNKCIKHSKGEFLLIQDIDDASYPDRIETLVTYLKEHKDISFVSSAMTTFQREISMPTGEMVHRKKHPSRLDFLWNLPFYHPSTMFRRECIEAVHGYRVVPETKRMEDYDLFMRLYAAGYTGDNVDKELYYYRLDKNNISRRKFADRIDEMKVRMYGFDRMGLMPFAMPFTIKPYFAYIYQQIKYHNI